MDKSSEEIDDQVLAFYSEEAKRCIQSEAYFAACIMLGSVLEYILIRNYPLIQMYDISPESTSKKKLSRPSKSLDLFGLLNIFKEEGWLSKSDCGKYVDVIRIIRNWVHPDKLIRFMNKNKKSPAIENETFKALAFCLKDTIEGFNKMIMDKMMNNKKI